MSRDKIILIVDTVRFMIVCFSLIVNWYTVLLTKGDQWIVKDRKINGGIDIVLSQYMRTRVVMSLIVTAQFAASFPNWGRDVGNSVFALSIFSSCVLAWLGYRVVQDRDHLRPFILKEKYTPSASSS